MIDLTRLPADTTNLVAGFTASRYLPPQHRLLSTFIEALPEFFGYVTGACIGGDTAIGMRMAQKWPEAWHHVIIPASHSLISKWCEQPGFERVTTHQMPPGSSYAARNQAIVDACDVLVGVPEYPENDERSLRSGTWMTIRMGRRAGKIVLVQMMEEV